MQRHIFPLFLLCHFIRESLGVGILKEKIIVVSPEDAGKRIDVVLAGIDADMTRSRIQSLIKDGSVTLDDHLVKANYKVKNGDVIKLVIPEPKEVAIKPERIEIDIVYQDEDIAVINKPQGMVVHPATGNYTGTLVNALLYYCDNLSGINGEIRPGIVHRIDKDTSGLLVVAKNDLAHQKLTEQIKDKTASRIYWALVEGNVKNDQGTISAPIGRHPVERKKMAVVAGGRPAVTHYRVLERFGEATLIEAKLETGRTHQIRVHMQYIGHPVVGDPVYGYKKQKYSLNGQALHAKTLGLIHPSQNVYMQFEAPLPLYFEELLNKLRKKSSNE